MTAALPPVPADELRARAWALAILHSARRVSALSRLHEFNERMLSDWGPQYSVGVQDVLIVYAYAYETLDVHAGQVPIVGLEYVTIDTAILAGKKITAVLQEDPHVPDVN